MNVCLVCHKDTQYIYCSLSCSNVGRAVKNEAAYLRDPKKCLLCQEPIPYDKRFDNKYCSSSCSATANNLRRPKKPKPPNKSLHNQMMERFHAGILTKRPSIRKALIETRGNKCSKCGLNPIWENSPLIMTVEHIDGNAGNNSPENLCLLCPNCHSQTPTFCGKNIGNGRQSRGLSKS